MLYQLSYQANWELAFTWVDHKPVDDGYRCIYLMKCTNFTGMAEVRVRIPVEAFLVLLKCPLKSCQDHTHSFQSAVLIHRIHPFHHISIIYGLMVEPHNDQLPVGLIIQLLGHCNGIAEARVRISVQAFLATAKVAQKNCEDHTHTQQ